LNDGLVVDFEAAGFEHQSSGQSDIAAEVCRAGDVDANFVVIRVGCGAGADEDAGDFKAVAGEDQLSSGFDAAGFFGDQHFAGGGFKLDQTEVDAVRADDTVDHDVIHTGDTNFTAVCGLDGAGAVGANAFGAGHGGGAG